MKQAENNDMENAAYALFSDALPYYWERGFVFTGGIK